MIRLAVTGNIGSGKTTICKIFESLDIAVYYADIEAKKLYSRKDVIASVKELFGEHVFDSENKLRSSDLAEIVFNDPGKLKQLNNIIHPLVLDDFLAWAKEHYDAKYIIYESALLFESGFIRHFDKSILVIAPQTLAMSRVMKRDGISESAFKARAGQQESEDKKRQLADYLIHNDETTPLIPQVIALHEIFCSLSE